MCVWKSWFLSFVHFTRLQTSHEVDLISSPLRWFCGIKSTPYLFTYLVRSFIIILHRVGWDAGSSRPRTQTKLNTHVSLIVEVVVVVVQKQMSCEEERIIEKNMRDIHFTSNLPAMSLLSPHQYHLCFNHSIRSVWFYLQLLWSKCWWWLLSLLIALDQRSDRRDWCQIESDMVYYHVNISVVRDCNKSSCSSSVLKQTSARVWV